MKEFSSKHLVLRVDVIGEKNTLFADASVHFSAQKLYRLGQWWQCLSVHFHFVEQDTYRVLLEAGLRTCNPHRSCIECLSHWSPSPLLLSLLARGSVLFSKVINFDMNMLTAGGTVLFSQVINFYMNMLMAGGIVLFSQVINFYMNMLMAGGTVLFSQVINFYMDMLMERGEQDGFSKTYTFNTFFYPKLIQGGHAAVRRWTRKVDIFSHQYLVIPVHLGVHWCLCVSSSLSFHL